MTFRSGTRHGTGEAALGGFDGTARRGRPAVACSAVPASLRPAFATLAACAGGRRGLGDAGVGGDQRGGAVQFVGGDVGVAADGREVGVAEVGGNQAGIAGLLAQPGSGAVAERVCGDPLLEVGALGGAADDRGEDRRLQALAREAAEDRCVGCRLPGVAQVFELTGKRRRERLPARLAALAAADEQRGPRPSSSRSDQSSAISSERRSPV